MFVKEIALLPVPGGCCGKSETQPITSYGYYCTNDMRHGKIAFQEAAIPAGSSLPVKRWEYGYISPTQAVVEYYENGTLVLTQTYDSTMVGDILTITIT